MGNEFALASSSATGDNLLAFLTGCSGELILNVFVV